jgi:hypothetical protein
MPTMLDPFSAWGRLVAAGFSATGTGLQALETIGAAQDVVAARTVILQSAMTPRAGEQAELGLMVAEKIEAFSRVGSVTIAACWSAHAAWLAQVHYLGGMAARGRPPTQAEYSDWGEQMAVAGLETVEAGARLGSDALAPIRRSAVGNARRLKRTADRRPR